MQKSDLKQLALPDEPGVYRFLKGRQILYIGKAASLRDRVRSYFSADLSKTRGTHMEQMVESATSIAHDKTDSVLEALILEANLIKRHSPPYNAASKDNKSFNYVVITKEEFPRVLVVRGRDLYQGTSIGAAKYVFGPFPHGLQLQEAMKIVRRIFPFRDAKCTPCVEQRKSKRAVCRPCFNRQLGLCPGVCTGEVSKTEYGRIVKHICELFSGNFRGLKRSLAREMKERVKDEQFEQASVLRRQISSLEHIKDVSLIKAESRVSSGGGARIEAFDVAHTAGHETVAVMTVVHSGEKLTSGYRMFKIRMARNDDIAALTEALERRLTHSEWPLPRIFVVDGGRAQLRAAERVLKRAGLLVPVVGVVKDERHKPAGLIGERRAIEAFGSDILLANGEAHRFGITWHRRRMRTAMY